MFRSLVLQLGLWELKLLFPCYRPAGFHSGPEIRSEEMTIITSWGGRHLLIPLHLTKGDLHRGGVPD
jgi:hypothetical protein